MVFETPYCRPPRNNYGHNNNNITPMYCLSLINSLKDRFDTILIDSPPFLSLNDAFVWSKNVDSLIYIVDFQKANPSMVQQVINDFDIIEVPILGCIVNRVKKNHSYYYYGYGGKSNHYYENNRVDENS